jgi:hypothetical protein
MVRFGDTLSGIGFSYHTSVGALVRVNHIFNPNLIFPAERLCIPRATAPGRTGTGGGPVLGHNSVVTMIYQTFGPYAGGAVNVARCESGFNPGAYNPISIYGSHAAGVFQILYPSTWRGTPQSSYSPYDAWPNIQAAHNIFVRDGYSWREWVCRPY